MGQYRLVREIFPIAYYIQYSFSKHRNMVWSGYEWGKEKVLDTNAVHGMLFIIELPDLSEMTLVKVLAAQNACGWVNLLGDLIPGAESVLA